MSQEILQRIERKEATQDLSAGALAFTYEFTQDGYFHQLLLGFSVATSQALTVTFNSKTGTNYDVVLDSQTFSSTTDYVYQPSRPIFFEKGDTLDIAITAGGSAIVYLTAFIEKILNMKAQTA